MANKEIIKQKEEEVNALVEKMKDAKLVLFTDYRGINVEDVTKLRAKLRTSNTEYKIVKNNISRRALAKCEIEGLDAAVEGPTAVIIGHEDYLEPAKAIYEYTKDHDFYKIKGGVIEGKVIIPPVELDKIARLLQMTKGELINHESDNLVPDLQYVKEFSNPDNLDRLLDLMDEYVELREVV